jgi:AraC-like DNA-binding protein
VILFCKKLRINGITKSYIFGGGAMPKRSSSLEKAREQEVTLEILPLHEFQSFRCFRHNYPALGARYCVHVEYEIHLIRKGTGHYKIGGVIGKFKAGQVSIVGSKVPHDWISDLRKDQVIQERDVVIQFSRDWLEKVQQLIPEVSDLTQLLQDSQRAIIFQGDSQKKIADALEEINSLVGFAQVLKLFEILIAMSKAPESEREYVLEDAYATDLAPRARLAVEKGAEYIFSNIQKKISLAEAAKLSYMSESAFSRMFKEASGLNFSDMTRKIRVEHGCKLLESTSLSVAAIAKDSGFTNLSNFNRQFLKEVGITPRDFRALSQKDKVKLLEKIFGHRNQLLQQPMPANGLPSEF